MASQSFDYIIIGAGSAGSVVAGRLSESGKYSVCVLEAGPVDRNPFIHIPAGVLYTLKNPAINWMYKGAAGAGIGGRAIDQARGKTLGGSGSINGHIYNRGQRMDFDSWAQKGNHGWGYADVLPYFRRSENKIGSGDQDFHGHDGPFTVTDIDEKHPLCDAFIDAAVSLGIPHNPDYNGRTQEGIAYAQRSVHRGRRVSPARSFLYPAIRRGNTEVVTNAHVRQILIADKQAVGVRYQRGGRTGPETTIRANREVILCAGAIASPQLLQISGIGAAQHLQELAVPVIQDLAGVGENFRDHYAVRSVARIQGLATINEKTRGLGLVREVAKYALWRRGALALTPTLVYCFWKSHPGIDHGDIQLTFTPASYPHGVQSGLDRFPGATIACWQQRSQSAGYVRARSADPYDQPEIQANYLVEEEDRRILLAALRLSRQLLQANPFAAYVAEERWPGPTLQSDDELLDHARQTGNTAYHPMGTCRMGPKDQPQTVVDDQLRVHGIAGLRVADASIMPMMPSANLNAGALMIGEKAADMILGNPPLAPQEIPA
ncbi:MAG: GMC family oxidoreductase N-terminal domain-containing protein [Rhodospirillales bacterium]|nr:GMC family oxidoreductase N-terminal domain-containing protein [Rhodospirillales bacterium]